MLNNEKYKKKSRNESCSFSFWQRMRDSNPRERSQSPVCYRYTNPLCATRLRQARILLYPFRQKSQAIFSCFANFFRRCLLSMSQTSKLIPKEKVFLAGHGSSGSEKSPFLPGPGAWSGYIPAPAYSGGASVAAPGFS